MTSPTGTSHDRPAPLLGLPMELLEWVVTYLPSEDLFNLRRSCSDLANGTTRYMAKTYFKTLHVLMLDQNSISRLMCIARHPVYKLAVKMVYMNIATLSETAARKKELSAIRRAVYAEHFNFRTSAFALIAHALDAFHKAGNIPEFNTLACQLYPTNPSVLSPWGTKQLIRQLGAGPLTYGNPFGDQKAFEILCHAIFESGAPVPRLKLGDDHYRFDPFIMGRVSLDYPEEQPFRYLKHLELWLDHYRVDSWLEGKARERRESDIDVKRLCVLHIVSQAHRLESLSIDSSGSYCSYANRSCDAVIFRSLATDKLPGFPKPLQQLRDLMLQGHEVPKQTLLDFIVDHKTTLKSLDLWEVMDGKRDDPDIKDEIFATAHDIQGFKLRIGRVYEGTSRSMYPGDDGWALPEWETAESERQPLRRAIGEEAAIE